jgi:amidase
MKNPQTSDQSMHDPFNCFCTHISMTIAGAPAGPLAGLTFAAKDNFDIAGYPTGGGSPDWLRTHGRAQKTAPSVQTLLDAGATLIGKTQMDELAFSLAGQNAHYGTPINPNAPDRIPGGSSSGSAAATAGGLVDFDLGTDTAGSVRVPASNCGIYGFRPTHGRIPIEGLVPFSPSFDTVGFFSRDAEMLRRVGLVLLPSSQPSFSLGKGRLLIADDAFAVADPDVRNALTPILPLISEVFGPQEHLQVSPQGLDFWAEQFNTLRGAEVRDSLGEWIEKTQPQFGPGIRERFALTRNITPEAVAAARNAREGICRHLDGLLATGNILCLPTSAVLAPLLTSPEPVMARYRALTLKVASVATVGGLPQINLPLARWQGCPVGMSLIAGRGQDAVLWDIAAEVEQMLRRRGRPTHLTRL